MKKTGKIEIFLKIHLKYRLNSGIFNALSILMRLHRLEA